VIPDIKKTVTVTFNSNQSIKKSYLGWEWNLNSMVTKLTACHYAGCGALIPKMLHKMKQTFINNVTCTGRLSVYSLKTAIFKDYTHTSNFMVDDIQYHIPEEKSAL
jgi:hypothetical protein